MLIKSPQTLVDVPENATAEEKNQIELENDIAMTAYKNYFSGNFVQAPMPKVYPGMKVVYQASEDSFLGTGRATYFTGSTGNRNNMLKGGDLAL